MRLLAIVNGEYGRRHVENIQTHKPDDWQIEVWQAPLVLPPVIDYPEDYLPEEIPPADLILSFAEIKGVAELLPDIAQMSGARAVIVSVDNDSWLPRGLGRQLRDWLARMNVACATPKPLCSLTEVDYGVTLKGRIAHDSPEIAEFARYFGRPELKVFVDPELRTIARTDVLRDAVCGCARYVAEGLIGVSVDEAEEKAGLLHHHYPCLASMVKDPDFNHDTLMHNSGHILRDQIGSQLKPFKDTRYISPGKRSDP